MKKPINEADLEKKVSDGAPDVFHSMRVGLSFLKPINHVHPREKFPVPPMDSSLVLRHQNLMHSKGWFYILKIFKDAENKNVCYRPNAMNENTRHVHF